MVKDVEDMSVYAQWEWKGFSAEVRVDYKRAVGLVNDEVEVRRGDVSPSAVVKEVYEHLTYCSSRDNTQNGYNCPICQSNYNEKEKWEKHLHLNHYEEFSEKVPYEVEKERDVENLSMDDSLDMILESLSNRSYKCRYNDKKGFTRSLLANHLIKEHPEEVFY